MNCNKHCNNGCDNQSRASLLHEIMSLNFAINDLVLYLDTHPTDSRAINMHSEYSEKVIELTQKYQKLYGPLTVNFSSETWDWIDQPWPWERSAY